MASSGKTVGEHGRLALSERRASLRLNAKPPVSRAGPAAVHRPPAPQPRGPVGRRNSGPENGRVMARGGGLSDQGSLPGSGQVDEVSSARGAYGGTAPQAPAAGALDLTKQHYCENTESSGPYTATISHLFGADGALQDKFAGYRLRGRWISHDGYQVLRNTAWMVRNSRVGGANNPLALRVVVAEVEKLMRDGESIADVIEALCELLVHP